MTDGQKGEKRRDIWDREGGRRGKGGGRGHVCLLLDGKDEEGWLSEEEMEEKSESDGKGNEKAIGGGEAQNKGLKEQGWSERRSFAAWIEIERGKTHAAAAAARGTKARHYKGRGGAEEGESWNTR